MTVRRAAPGPRLTSLRGLAQDRQGNVRALPLVWQRTQLGFLPCRLEARGIWQLILRGTPLGRGVDNGGGGW